jgi:hypothetical protein
VSDAQFVLNLLYAGKRTLANGSLAGASPFRISTFDTRGKGGNIVPKQPL